MPYAICNTAIDWAGTGTMLQGCATLLGAGAVVTAAIIGVNTFEIWRKQKITERHIEQAERILTATYKVRRGLSYVRNPMMLFHETEKAEEVLKENGEWAKASNDVERRKFATAQAYYNRLNLTKDDQRKLEECQPMARAFFGENIEKAIEKLNRQFWTVQFHVDAQVRSQGANPEFTHKIECALYEGFPYDEDNEVDRTIVEQIAIIESVCVPVLCREGGMKEK